MTLLSVENLRVTLAGKPVVRGVSFTLERGQVLGLCGASGSGKSMTSLALMRLLPGSAALSGQAWLEGEDLLALDEDTMCKRRGGRIGMVFQEPMTALDPMMSIGNQIAEALMQHERLSRKACGERLNHLLERVGLAAQDVTASRYPHELSGGQRQRVVIAMAIAARPALLIADEPTTALDVTTQAGILNLLLELVREESMGLLLISHDLAMLSSVSDRMAVMHDGAIVEAGETRELLLTMRHPRALELWTAGTHASAAFSQQQLGKPLLMAEGIERHYKLPRTGFWGAKRWKQALIGVDIMVNAGECVALIGESGSGKSTLARIVLGLEKPHAGRVVFDGVTVDRMDKNEARRMRRRMQAVFQDPYTSLDPRRTIGWSVAEPMAGNDQVSPQAVQERVAEALVDVGLSPADAERYPHAFSGGQRQRIALARALITRPELIVLDEPVSSLDAVVRHQILDLLNELREKHGLAYLFITHDLNVARVVANRIVVLRNGQVVESGDTATVLDTPQHVYTRSLVQALPI